ncbi:hypothetical protein PVAP13_3KG229727 [Panicum virgatum]|uniref:Uncharacterized protein n=1 Tax=Panicum virgatum TaxID=38727 RepID=A0A8T0V1C8_PANVG|nr:hypothetical protein PVAP13_3KG229727 [Panicum virgatum]
MWSCLVSPAQRPSTRRPSPAQRPCTAPPCRHPSTRGCSAPARAPPCTCGCSAPPRAPSCAALLHASPCARGPQPPRQPSATTADCAFRSRSYAPPAGVRQ